jgi:hypothetical protein
MPGRPSVQIVRSLAFRDSVSLNSLFALALKRPRGNLKNRLRLRLIDPNDFRHQTLEDTHDERWKRDRRAISFR